MRATIIKAGPVEFHSEAARGFTIPPGGFTGWTDPVGARIRESLRPQGPGAAAVPQQLGTRLVSISGTCWADSPQDLDRYGNLLGGLGADGEAFQINVRHAGRWLHANAYRAAGVRFEEFPALNRAAYQYDFWCPDPRKYGESREIVSSGANVQAFHYGNTDAWPVFTVTGFANGYRIIGPGGTYQVGSKSAGAVDTIDFSDGLLVRNGNHVTRQVSQRDVWPVRPFQQSQWRVQAVGSGSGTATMTLADTYI